MHFERTWPFLILGLLFQLFMQISCISKAIREEKRKSFRALYISSVAVFGLAAVALHLFRARKIQSRNSDSENDRADNSTNKGIFFLLVIAYQVMGLHLLAENAETDMFVPLILLVSASFLIMLLYNVLPEKKAATVGMLLPILQMILCIPIQYLDVSGDNLFLSIIAGFGAINRATLSKAKAYWICGMGAYLLGSTARTINSARNAEIPDLVRYFFVNTIVVMLALLAFYTLKKQMIIGEKLKEALRTVNEQSEKLKNLAVVEERNRIAAEMHDTVGHTLTAAVLTLEAAEGLVSEERAAQIVRQGKEQVKRGLSELRDSVKMVRAGNAPDFAAVLECLLREIRSDIGLDINLCMESPIILPPLQAGILLSAVKECTTNAIRHGQATHADILIGEHNGQIRLTFTDNGRGAEVIKPGSGLSIMRERLQSVGGTLETESAPQEGVTVILSIPAVQNKEDEQ
ncbi:MAG TPA: sensor histidine kinase [Clostridia bacterium]|nr:sensor histidine kinase [Clostridia bacterium]